MLFQWKCRSFRHLFFLCTCIPIRNFSRSNGNVSVFVFSLRFWHRTHCFRADKGNRRAVAVACGKFIVKNYVVFVDSVRSMEENTLSHASLQHPPDQKEINTSLLLNTTGVERDKIQTSTFNYALKKNTLKVLY